MSDEPEITTEPEAIAEPEVTAEPESTTEPEVPAATETPADALGSLFAGMDESIFDAADAMVKRGCWKAYTLDGGRTATTVFHYELINPVQYGKEIPISDIIYVSGMKDYVMFYLEGEKRPLVTHLTMKTVEDILPAADFMRVHRSYIVALRKIKSIDRNNTIQIGDEFIHVSEGYLDAFNAYLKANLP